MSGKSAQNKYGCVIINNYGLTVGKYSASK